MNVFDEEVMDDLEEDTDVSNKVYATTKGGKEIVIYQRLNYWQVKFNSGGQLPKELTGRFTGHLEASETVNEYLAKDVEPATTVVKKRKNNTKKA